ncbi:kinase-like protein [Rhizophagus irregularis]|nr:kinase-like protein [Rhizophagus irregularis]
MNSNEDWYQSAIFEYKINEITEHFVNKDLIGIVVAIKEVNIISNDYNSLKTFITELKIYNRINNKRIIQFYGISRNAEKKLYYLVLEYANQGNLREFINEKNRNENDFEWKERVNLATQIAEGLCYLHKLNIAHRDLFEAANFKRRSQPLGARPNQLSKDNVEIFVESISVIEAYKTCFRFTNKPLQLDFILSEPKNASEKSLYFNDQGLLECQLKRIDL